MQADDEFHLHRTAVSQVLAFTLQALTAKDPCQEWYDTAHERLSAWEVEYLDILREIPETIRKEPLSSNYRPSYWELYPKTYNTRSRGYKIDMGSRIVLSDVRNKVLPKLK